jgi:hypothetical protein
MLKSFTSVAAVERRFEESPVRYSFSGRPVSSRPAQRVPSQEFFLMFWA